MKLVEKLGDRIRRIRKEMGLSQEQLAERSGLHTNYIGAIERGEKNVTVESLEKVAGGLGITLEELFRFVDPMPDKDDLAHLIELLEARGEAERKLALSLLQSIFEWGEQQKTL